MFTKDTFVNLLVSSRILKLQVQMSDSVCLTSLLVADLLSAPAAPAAKLLGAPPANGLLTALSVSETGLAVCAEDWCLLTEPPFSLLLWAASLLLRFIPF